MSKDEKLQWRIIEKAKKYIMDWSKKNSADIYAVHFVPMFDFSLEVYIFYAKDIDIVRNDENGITNNVRRVFCDELSDMGYMKSFGDNIKFIFDSHENVVNNYNGSYFLRLR